MLIVSFTGLMILLMMSAALWKMMTEKSGIITMIREICVAVAGLQAYNCKPKA